MNDNTFRIQTSGSRWGLPPYDPNSSSSSSSSSRSELPLFDQVLIPKDESDLLTERNVTKIDHSCPSLEIIGSISTQTFNPQPTVESLTFGYQLYAESTVTSPGSYILLSKELSSLGGLPVDWETKAVGTFWDYHSTMKEGANGEYHQFTLKPQFSHSDTEKIDILNRENLNKFPAVMHDTKFIDLESDPRKHYLKIFGFGYDAEREIFRVPSLMTLIRNWDQLRQTRPEMPPLRIILCEGTEDDLEFAYMVSKGLIPVSIDTEREHDITVHVMSWLELLTNLETKEDVAHYVKTKALNSKMLSHYLEALTGEKGKALTDKAYEQYTERSFRVKIDQIDQIELDKFKLKFYYFCHSFLGYLADSGSAHYDFARYASITKNLLERMHLFRFDSNWEQYFVKRHGVASGCFLYIFTEEITRLVGRIGDSE